ncbi:MAG: diguanylate cyclase [Spirochaetia bacterium]|nr:diguanylate cyclase [Spirochaetia bacterium]
MFSSKNTKLISYIRTLSLSFVLFYAIFAAYDFLYEPRGVIISDDWEDVVINSASLKEAEQLSTKIPFYYSLKDGIKISLTNQIEWSSGDLLVIPRVCGNQLRVYVDDQKIYQYGTDDISANMWTGFHYVELPTNLSSGKLKFEMTGQHEAGMISKPYIVTQNGNIAFLFFSKLIINNIYSISIGVYTAFIMLFSFFALASKEHRSAYIFFMVSGLPATFYNFEFMLRESSGNADEYLLIKKLLTATGILCSWLFMSGIELLYRKKLKIAFFLLPLTIGLDVYLLIQEDLYALRSANLYAIAFSFINWGFMLYFAFRLKDQAVLFMLSFFIFVTLYSYLNVVFNFSPIFLFHFSFLSVITCLALLATQDYVNVNRNYQEIKKKSLIDPLTGAYNRNIMDELKYEFGDRIVVVDLDGFKTVNDTHGHDVGDKLLKLCVNIFKKNIRKDDLIIRFGGDEFIIILRKNASTDIIKRVKQEFEDVSAEYHLSFSFGEAVLEESVDKAVLEADKLMYMNKVAKKK